MRTGLLVHAMNQMVCHYGDVYQGGNGSGNMSQVDHPLHMRIGMQRTQALYVGDVSRWVEGLHRVATYKHDGTHT